MRKFSGSEELSLIINQTSLRKRLLPNTEYIYIYIYIYVYTYIYIYIYIYSGSHFVEKSFLDLLRVPMKVCVTPQAKYISVSPIAYMTIKLAFFSADIASVQFHMTSQTF